MQSKLKIVDTDTNRNLAIVGTYDGIKDYYDLGNGTLPIAYRIVQGDTKPEQNYYLVIAESLAVDIDKDHPGKNTRRVC